ncbi:MAG: hypothetical protein GF421_04595 [Candidatus Aminicenantes bacterium]|nr:hypothetical protein [Candidatus Aminicenantes bacterium]
MDRRRITSDVLIKRIDLEFPLVGFYDAPDPDAFKPLVKPDHGDCVFLFFNNWKRGQTLHITRDHYGCGGAGHWMWGIQTRSKEEFIQFLVGDEGLKASNELMEQWFDQSEPYHSEYAHLFVGPYKQELWDYIKTVTFFVNPDQLSALMIGAQYHRSPEDPCPVIAPFGSGCFLLQPFQNLNIPQAAIGATDIAMRQHLPPDMLTLTVTKPMFVRLCELDEQSFLYKPFLKRLREARGLPDLD